MARRKVSGRIEDAFEATIFASRWILAPAYICLVATLAVLSYKTAEEFVQLALNLRVFDEARSILQVLTIVDLVLILNLILMIILVGYVNFVSQIKPKKSEDWPVWMTHLDYAGLKLQLLGSIIAVASVKLLRMFVEFTDIGQIDEKRVVLMALLYFLFLVAVLVVAVVNRLKLDTVICAAPDPRECADDGHSLSSGKQS